MKLFRKSKSNIKIPKFKDKFELRMSFDNKITPEIKKDVINTLKKYNSHFIKRVNIQKCTEYDMILWINVITDFFSSTTDRVKEGLIDVANDYQFNVGIYKGKKGSKGYSCYDWEEKSYSVYYTVTEVQERVAYINARSTSEAENKFEDGDYYDSEFLDTIDCYDTEVTSVERN